MYLWNKILLGVIIVVAMVFFYFAARAVNIHASWLEATQKLEKEISDTQAENEKLLEGGGVEAPEEIGLRDARLALHRLTVDRPRAWRNCDAEVRTNPLSIQVTIGKPDPSGIKEKMILFAFEEPGVQEQGRYLGEFVVTKAAGKQLELAPANNLFQRDVAKLAHIKKTWVLYEYLPKDRRDVFAKLTDEQKKALPEATADEYLNDGRPAAEDVPAQRKDAEGNYVRALRDYTVLLAVYRERQTDLYDQVELLKRDVKYVQTALADAQRQNRTYQRQIAELKAQKAKAEVERDFVDRYRLQLATEIEGLEKEYEKVNQQNRAMAGQLAQLQGEAARRIDQRVRAMVLQPGNGMK
ncbi:MAG: hypothetical protein JXB10_12855 [Pirellulales bacterium]|nr:hypothetical protein [Pirellulales bacterium]